MRFVKNVDIDKDALAFMLRHKGVPKPNLETEAHQYSTYHLWIAKGYDVKKLYWESFSGENFPWPVKIPVEGSWWFSKLPPGSVFPMHQDTYSNTEASQRFWIACQDYEPGHIFTYGDKILTGYKAGDMFEFEDPLEWHGAANCGLSTKISLQVVVNKQ